MTEQDRIKILLDLLNILPPSSLPEKGTEALAPSICSFLRESGLCYYVLGSHNYNLCLLTLEEAKHLREEGQELPYLVEKNLEKDDTNPSFFLDGERNKNKVIDIIWQTVQGLRDFIDKCIGGTVDINYLNRVLPDEEMEIKFEYFGSPMRPVVCPRLPDYFGHDRGLETNIRFKLLFPLVLSHKSPLSKIKRCRRCGTFFLGKRLSATFCSDKCRGAFHHANA